MTPSVTQDQAFTALRACLLAMLTGVEVAQGQTNRVPMPASKNFITMTAGARGQMSTTSHTYAPPTAPAPALGANDVTRSTSLRFQLDVYGPASADNAQIITTLLRDDFGVDFLAAYHLAPLYCDDPAQMPIVAGEQQYIARWMIGVALHGNIAVTLPLGFADTLITGLSEITHGE